MPLHDPLGPDTNQSDQQTASTDSLGDEDDEGKVEKSVDHLAGLTPRQYDELVDALTHLEEKTNNHQREVVEDAIFNTIATGLRAFIDRSEYLYDHKANVAIAGLSFLANDSKGFEIAVESLFQLIERHYTRDTILRPDPTRCSRKRAMREREEMEAVEFFLLRMLANRWTMARYESGPIAADPTLFLDAFFRKHGWFLEWIGGFEFLCRLDGISRKRQVATMISRKALAARLPNELIETVQDSICGVEGVKKLLTLVAETSSESVERIWGKWMNGKFSELSL